LLVVGGHQRSERQGLEVADPADAVKRSTSNVAMRVDVTAAAWTHASTVEREAQGEVQCGTSYGTPGAAGTVAAMLSPVSYTH
ncbi:peptidase S8 and S53 subtilisin kexin sedolisin, partial [Pseudomonas aeruginosa]